MCQKIWIMILLYEIWCLSFFTSSAYKEEISYTHLIINSELPSHAHIEAMVITLLYEYPIFIFTIFMLAPSRYHIPISCSPPTPALVWSEYPNYYFLKYRLSRSPTFLFTCDYCGTEICTNWLSIGHSLVHFLMPFLAYMAISLPNYVYYNQWIIVLTSSPNPGHHSVITIWINYINWI